MGRYTGPKGRINRRLGINVYESNGAIRALEKKETPPGMHKRRKKPTNYGLGLAEKQKIKFYYGLRDRQLNRYFDKPGIMVRPGDIITLRKRPNIERLYKSVQEGLTIPQVEWINYDDSNFSAVVTTLPSFDDVGLIVDANQVVAFLSR